MAHKGIYRTVFTAMAVVVAALFSACYSADDNQDDDGNTNGHSFDDTDPTLPEGESAFISADGQEGQQSAENSADDSSEAGAADEDSNKEDSTVEEGDIYRVLENSKILNLNAYRGLQIIDFTNPKEPSVIGRLQVSGTPVELYVYENRAIVMINNWRGYYGSRNDITVEEKTGGLILIVDLADPEHPRLVDRAFIDGYISTSRLTRGGDQAALFVAASYYSEYENDLGQMTWGSHTVVKSFDVSGKNIIDRTQIELGGYVTDIQATTKVLMVASHNWNSSNNQSTVALIDISNPDGTMIMGSSVKVAGYVASKTNMNFYNGVLRVASGSRWGGSSTNHVQTFNASDYGKLSLLDHCTFGDGEDLYATIFLGNKAFFVTYFRVDPFHAFEIDDAGKCTERSEFIVSGWNDYFRPVFDEKRLLGIGVNDDNRRTMAVSLYDITDLSQKNPLIKRAEVAAESSWSEASWDDRAFSVLEDAVSVETDGGVLETGLVLLPFQGYDSNWENYFAGVQIYTFSENTLTRRGVMDHGSQVRRSFQPEESMTANLSEEELSFFDSSSPDSPSELGRVSLAPNYTDVLRFGKYSVRVEKPQSGYYYWNGENRGQQKTFAEIILSAEHADQAKALATLELAGSPQIFKVHNTLFSLSYAITDSTQWPYEYETTITIYDMSYPLQPKELVTLKTDQLKPQYGGYYWDEMIGDCFDCYWGGYGDAFQHAILKNAVVFPIVNQEQKKLGEEERCYLHPDYQEACYYASYNKYTGTCYQGSVSCTSLNGDPEFCQGAIEKCQVDATGEISDCVEVERDEVPFEKNCYTREKYRYWNSYAFLALDLTANPPAFEEPVVMPKTDEGTGFLGYQNNLYFSYRVPFDVKDDSRPYVKYYFKEIDFGTPGDPKVGKGINIPGSLIDVRDNLVYTEDVVWGQKVVETTINKLQVKDGKAYRLAGHRFIDQDVDKIVLDPYGRALVSHRLAWYASEDYYDTAATQLSILDDDLSKIGGVEVDNWATLSDANNGRALFEVPGGLLIINLKSITSPFAQAYFPVRGWPQSIYFENNEIVFAAGRYGIYQFSADTFNLLSF